jgi:hypothetical protein
MCRPTRRHGIRWARTADHTRPGDSLAHRSQPDQMDRAPRRQGSAAQERSSQPRESHVCDRPCGRSVHRRRFRRASAGAWSVDGLSHRCTCAANGTLLEPWPAVPNASPTKKPRLGGVFPHSGGGIETPTPDAQETVGRPTPHERTLASTSMSGVSPAMAPNGHPRMRLQARRRLATRFGCRLRPTRRSSVKIRRI